MIRQFNIANNELTSREGSPLIEITHFNDENEINKKETYTVGYFLKEAKELKRLNTHKSFIKYLYSESS